MLNPNKQISFAHTSYTDWLRPRYFPFPHPISAINDPTGISLINWDILGHGVCLVPLKWSAISSYTCKTICFRLVYTILDGEILYNIYNSRLFSFAYFYIETVTLRSITDKTQWGF